MAKSKVKLKDRLLVARDTVSYVFEKPDGFTFVPGQFAELKLLDPPETDAEGDTRAFTLSSAPFEERLMMTTRLRDSAFKRSLQKVPLGTELMLDGPYGSFTLHRKEAVPAVFLAGGIGVTPPRSILLQAAHDHFSHRLYLFYSNHTAGDAAFLDELKALEKQNTNFQFVPTMTSMESSDGQWDGHQGHIDKELLLQYIPDMTKPIYYISGPGAMVKAMRETLNASGIDEDNIRTEEFPGY